MLFSNYHLIILMDSWGWIDQENKSLSVCETNNDKLVNQRECEVKSYK